MGPQEPHSARANGFPLSNGSPRDVCEGTTIPSQVFTETSQTFHKHFIAWAFATATQSIAALLAALAKAAVRRTDYLKEQGLANSAWAFATTGRSDVPLFTTLTVAAERRVGKFKGQDLANTAWAFSTRGRSDAPLFATLARAATWSEDEFSEQNLANTA